MEGRKRAQDTQDTQKGEFKAVAMVRVQAETKMWCMRKAEKREGGEN